MKRIHRAFGNFESPERRKNVPWQPWALLGLWKSPGQCERTQASTTCRPVVFSRDSLTGKLRTFANERGSSSH